MSSRLQNIPGMNDALPADTALWQKMERAAQTLFSRYGFREMRTPLLEDTALFSRGIGEATQVVQKEMYTFIDRGGDSVTLRPEGTAGIVRSYVQNGLKREEPLLKIYYMGPMFRYERPQKGRLRQFHQIGAETFGTSSPIADAELIIMVARFLTELGIDNYELKINNLGIAAERDVYTRELQNKLRTQKEKFCTSCQERIERNPLRVLDCKSPVCQENLHDAPALGSFLGDESRQHGAVVLEQLEKAGVKYTNDPRLVRGLDYYDLTAFEFTSSALGSQSAFAGGGRYNRLVSELGGEETPAVGFAIGCERLIIMLHEANKTQTTPLNKGYFFVALDDQSYDLALTHVQKCRDSGIAADILPELKSLKAQMKQANRSGLSHAVVIGEEERHSLVFTVKNLATGEQERMPADKICRLER